MTEQQHYLGHRERLRHKILTFGGASLEDYELMEFALMQSIPRKDVKPLAKELIKTFGSFALTIEVPANELMKIQGIKESTVALFALLKESTRRLMKHQFSDAPIFNNWDSLLAYCRVTLGHQKIEILSALFLDNKNRLIKDEILQEGTVNQTMIYPREVAKRALELCAVGVILIHNHPADDLRPSKNDLIMTQSVFNALKTVEITLIDHLIVSKSGHLSFKEQGYLK